MSASQKFAAAGLEKKKKAVPRPDPNDPSYQRKLRDNKHALDTIMALFKDMSGSALQKWLRVFDKNLDMCVNYDEFCEGLAKLNYPGDPTDLFRKLDIDGSGEIMLEEIDLPGSKLWMTFRMWCAAQFEDPNHMIYTLSKQKDRHSCSKADFIESLQRLQWSGGREEVIFQCLVPGGEEKLFLAYLKWFGKDKKKQHRKEQAKKHAMDRSSKAVKERQDIANAMDSFKAFLKKKYSTCLRAWRAAIDLDGSMTIQKPELFLAVKALAWPGDVRVLWKGLDKDDSGVTSLQELDLRCADRLAKFTCFCKDKFGSAVAAFRAFDVQNKGKMKQEEFIDACRKAGFSKMNTALFYGLDWQKNKYIMETDLAFLDSWRVPPYLTCAPNEEAAEEFKKCLIRVFKSYIKAWRSCLDRDNSNSVAYEEFEFAAKRIRFTGDVPGAWRALDDDVSGFISLREIDQEASRVISEFKCWAEDEFGGARRVFKVFAGENSFELTMKEWRKACVAFAFPGDSKGLFEALDADRSGCLSLNEVAFIDTWELSAAQLAEVFPMGEEKKEAAPKPVKKKVEMTERMMTLALPLPHKMVKRDDSCKELPSLLEASEPSTSKPLVSPYLPKLRSTLGLSLQISDLTFSKPSNTKKPKPLQTVSPFLDPAVTAHLESLKETIIHQPIPQVPMDNKPEIEEYDVFGLANLRKKTLDLRSRTLSLFGKVEHSDKGFLSPVIDSSTGKMSEDFIQDCDQEIENLLQDVIQSPPANAKAFGNLRLPKL